MNSQSKTASTLAEAPAAVHGSNESTAVYTSFFDIARLMAKRGMPIVPVQPQQKKCTLPEWQIKATTDAQQLQAWDAENPNYNTGCMASYAAGICVLDCDVLGLLKRIEQETGEKMPATFLVRSAGKGTAHGYFRHTECSRKLGNRKAAGVFDFKADRSYVVGPGSVLLKDGELREYRIVHDRPFADIPDWLCEWIEKNADAEKPQPQGCRLTHPDFDVKVKEAEPEPTADPYADPEPAPVAPDGFDFINEYVRCNDRYEAPAKLHEVIAISTLAAVANHNGVTFPYADRQHPMDLWLAALLRSGAGKNESLNVMRSLLVPLSSWRDLFNSTRWGSPEYFYESVQGRTSQFWAFTELSEFLGKLSSTRWAEVKPWLTDRFDSPIVPAAIKHRTNGKGETTTPNIEFLTAPRINILGMSNADWYLEKLRESDIRGGFLARFVPIAMSPSGRAVHYVKPPDAELWAALVRKLVDVTRLRGAADLSAVLSADPDCPYGRWYAGTQRRWSKGKGELADVLFARWRVFVLKLAVVFELSASGSLTVTEASFDRAARWLHEQEGVLFSVAELGGKRGPRLRRKLQFFEAAGTSGVRHSAYHRKYKHEYKNERADDLDTLLQAQDILRVKELDKPEVRGDALYVHRRFAHVIQ